MGVPICPFCVHKTPYFTQKLATELMARPIHSFCGTKMNLQNGTEEGRKLFQDGLAEDENVERVPVR